MGWETRASPVKAKIYPEPIGLRFSETGNMLCEKLSKSICERIMAGELAIEEAVAEINRGLDEIAEKHPEVNDSEPRAQLRYEIRQAFREIGANPKDFWL